MSINEKSSFRSHVALLLAWQHEAPLLDYSTCCRPTRFHVLRLKVSFEDFLENKDFFFFLS